MPSCDIDERGRKLGRSPSHQRALLRSLASALFLTERDAEFDDNKPKVKGRIITTISKAKEVRPLVEKCITIARRGLAAEEAASEFGTTADRGSDAWKSWRKSDQLEQVEPAIAPSVAARRRCLQLLGDKQAVRVLFDEVAPRFTDRPGGYTRILRLAKPRLGDAGTRAILEFVGVRDRVVERSVRPTFEGETAARRRSQEKAEATRQHKVTALQSGGWGRAEGELPASRRAEPLLASCRSTRFPACIDCEPPILLPSAARSKPTGTHSSSSLDPSRGHRPRCRVSMRIAIHFGAALALARRAWRAAAGCSPASSRSRKGHSPLQPAQPSPDSVAMEIIWARFPANDPVLDDAAWREIDETQIEPAVRRELVEQRLPRRRDHRLAAATRSRRVLHQGESPPDDAAIGRARRSRKAPTCSPSRSCMAARAACAAISAPKFRRRKSIHRCRCLVSGGASWAATPTNKRRRSTRCASIRSPIARRLVELTPEVAITAQPQLRCTGGDDGILRQASLRDRKVFDHLRLSVKLAPGEMLVLMSLPDAGSRLGHYFHTVDSADGPQQKLILIRLAEVPPSDTFADTADSARTSDNPVRLEAALVSHSSAWPPTLRATLRRTYRPSSVAA